MKTFSAGDSYSHCQCNKLAEILHHRKWLQNVHVHYLYMAAKNNVIFETLNTPTGHFYHKDHIFTTGPLKQSHVCIPNNEPVDIPHRNYSD